VKPRAAVLVVVCVGLALAFESMTVAQAVGPPTTGSDLGGMNLNAYCQSKGFGGATLTKARIGPGAAFNNWVCVSASGVQTPLNLQAACEYTFPQRPIAPEAPDLNDAFSWHCYQNGVASVPPGGSTHPKGGGTGGNATAACKRNGKGGSKGKNAAHCHSTASGVACNFIIASATDTCTATVGDTGSQKRSIPTGRVRFSSSPAGGAFIADTCELAPAPPLADTARCSVKYKPPATISSTVSASYGGDKRHKGSKATSNTLVPGNAAG
jgi:hypothetical protein